MGLILDTGILVIAERRGHTVGELFRQLEAAHGGVAVGVSAVTLTELAHGLERAKTAEQRRKRQSFLDDLMTDMSIHPLTAEIAWRAGLISGQEAARALFCLSRTS